MEKTNLVDHNMYGNLLNNFEKGENINNRIQWVHSVLHGRGLEISYIDNIFISYYMKKLNLIDYFNRLGITQEYELFYNIIFEYLECYYTSGVTELDNLTRYFHFADEDYYCGLEEEHIHTEPYSDEGFLKRLNEYKEDVKTVENFDPIKDFGKAVEHFAMLNSIYKIDKDQLFKGIKQPLLMMGITNTRPYIKIFKDNNYYNPEEDRNRNNHL